MEFDVRFIRHLFALTDFYCAPVRAGVSTPYQGFFSKLSDAEFMQYRNPVGRGPSGKTCPRCALQRLHITSTRRIPSARSSSVSTASLAKGAEKLGQPVPDSNFVSESNSSLPQHTQR